MRNIASRDASELEALEQREWLESLDYVIQQGDRGRVQRLLERLRDHARGGRRRPAVHRRDALRQHASAPKIRRRFPGSQEIERRIKSLVRWNAMAMVVRANRASDGIGGHISTYASAATLYEVGFNHFFRGKDEDGDGDLIYFQGHASPGIYARAFLEGRLSVEKLTNFRQELAQGGGLSSYPHPWLMPDFWEFPTVSMGLGPDHVDLPGALQSLPRRSRAEEAVEHEGVGVPRRRRDRRARDARRDQPGGARKARQPDLRHQLQPAAARRSGPRQRPDHPGARGDLPRRRLERHQGAVGQRLGSAARQRSRRPARQADGRDRRRPVSEVRRRGRRVPPRALLRRRPAPARDGQAPLRRTAHEASARRPRSRSRSTTPTRRRSSTRVSRRSFWRGRSRATASARRAKARTSPTSRRR